MRGSCTHANCMWDVNVSAQLWRGSSVPSSANQHLYLSPSIQYYRRTGPAKVKEALAHIQSLLEAGGCCHSVAGAPAWL